MKKCPSCGKEYEDSMKFCQVDGASLEAAEPALDPYATMVGHKLDLTKEELQTPNETTQDQPSSSSAAEPIIHETSGSVPIGPPDEILELPGVDPLKTMYVSESELKEALGTSGSGPAAPIDEPLPESNSESEPTIVAEPPVFGSAPPPPSPFSEPSRPFAEPESSTPTASSQFGDSFPTSSPDWVPPPAPDASWQNQQIGSNTPFLPPPGGGAAKSNGLAIGSLIAGILSCTICCSMGILLGPAALVMGFVAKKKSDESPYEFGGRGLAIGGMVTGGLGILFGIGYIIWLLFLGGLSMMSGR